MKNNSPAFSVKRPRMQLYDAEKIIHHTIGNQIHMLILD